MERQSGSTLISIVILLGFLSIFFFGLITLGNANLARAADRILALQAQYAAESGADAALAYLNNGTETYPGASNVSVVTNGARYRATFTSTVSTPTNSSGNPDTNKRIITATGYIYQPSSATTPTIERTVKILAQRSSNVTSTNILSRNIVHVGASVKDVIAKNIFVNNYIQMDKNVNNFIAESITVADRNPSASNCSISGGNLSKPSSVASTTLKLAFNNCSDLNGGASNFTLLENQTDIEKVQSTFIPWQYAMDPVTSVNRACSQWTSGASPRTIPFGTTPFTAAENADVSNNKSHYPDNGNGVVTSCTSVANRGSLDLGNDVQFNINQNVHVRADLCSNAPCRPIFNNPSTTTRYIFVEGSINFEQLRNAAGSGPIVFVSYGSDPSALTSVCPEGGAVRLGQQGNNNTNAPKIFMLSINGGMCLDGTKFSGANSLGGVSGKNLYIATNSGTPFDLSIDPDFPVNDVPVNLSFKATQYQRLY